MPSQQIDKIKKFTNKKWKKAPLSTQVSNVRLLSPQGESLCILETEFGRMEQLSIRLQHGP